MNSPFVKKGRFSDAEEKKKIISRMKRQWILLRPAGDSFEHQFPTSLHEVCSGMLHLFKFRGCRTNVMFRTKFSSNTLRVVV